MAELVTYEVQDSVTRIGMDDGKLNVLSMQMLAELHEAFERAADEGRPVVLSGRERALSAGFDLKVIRSSAAEAAEMFNAGFLLTERMLAFPAPLVVACTGHAIAMGLFLALGGDYRIGVSGEFRITANEVAMGMTLPRTPIELCRYRLNPAYFDRVVNLAELLSPDAAVAAGIFDRVVPSGEFDGAVAEIVGQVSALDLGAHRETKMRTRSGLMLRIAQAVADDDAEYRSAAGPPV